MRKLRLGPSLAAALLGIRRVSARQGWAGENSGLFEHPEWFSYDLLNKHEDGNELGSQ